MSGMNPIVVGLVSSVVAIAAYMIDLRLIMKNAIKIN